MMDILRDREALICLIKYPESEEIIQVPTVGKPSEPPGLRLLMMPILTVFPFGAFKLKSLNQKNIKKTSNTSFDDQSRSPDVVRWPYLSSGTSQADAWTWPQTVPGSVTRTSPTDATLCRWRAERKSEGPPARYHGNMNPSPVWVKDNYAKRKKEM